MIIKENKNLVRSMFCWIKKVVTLIRTKYINKGYKYKLVFYVIDPEHQKTWAPNLVRKKKLYVL